MHKFHITHQNTKGEQIEYDGIFRSAIEAIKDCVATFGFGRVKAIPFQEQAANQDMPRAA